MRRNASAVREQGSALSGKRYFGSVDSQHLLEDPDVVVQGKRALHLGYQVRR